ncbi:hypothetical protein ABMA09_25660 (plasmid) [Erwinia rhapontici]
MESIECDRMFIAVMETGSFTVAAKEISHKFRAIIDF